MSNKIKPSSFGPLTENMMLAEAAKGKSGSSSGTITKHAFRGSQPNGWDQRDYELWSAIRQLPSYGLIANDSDNPMLSRKDILALLEKHAEARFSVTHAEKYNKPNDHPHQAAQQTESYN